MTEATIRHMAIELAGKFYEQERSAVFRKAFPTVQHYLKGWEVVAEGAVKKVPSGWMHHVILARRVLVEMLKDNRVAEAMKERIAAALIEDRGKSVKFGQRVAQRMEREQDEKRQSRKKSGVEPRTLRRNGGARTQVSG
jgi:hypothetical protein